MKPIPAGAKYRLLGTRVSLTTCSFQKGVFLLRAKLNNRALQPVAGKIGLLAAFMGGVFTVGSTYAAISFASLAPSTVPCPHVITPGHTTTWEMNYFDASSSSIDAHLTTLNQSVVGQFPGYWSFTKNQGLTGSLVTQIYEPRDGPEACEHGTNITIYLSSFSGLEAGQVWEWAQMFDSSWGNMNTLDPPIGYHIPPPDDIDADTLPFYDLCRGDRHFFDGPAHILEEGVHDGWMSFRTFLTSWDGEYNGTSSSPEVVNVYGEITWGFDYACVPETSMVSLVVIGASMLMFGRRRRSTPISPPSGPTQWLFQGPPAQSKFLAVKFPL